jgi:hypothetical protein
VRRTRSSRPPGDGGISEPRLADLLALLADIHDTDEDCAVWHGPHVVCIRHGPDGRITWLRPEHRPAAINAA